MEIKAEVKGGSCPGPAHVIVSFLLVTVGEQSEHVPIGVEVRFIH